MISGWREFSARVMSSLQSLSFAGVGMLHHAPPIRMRHILRLSFDLFRFSGHGGPEQEYFYRSFFIGFTDAICSAAGCISIYASGYVC